MDSAPKPAMVSACQHCDGKGDDDDLLWPTRCDHCNGTGLESETELCPGCGCPLYPDEWCGCMEDV